MSEFSNDERLIEARFDALANTTNDSDWNDVLRSLGLELPDPGAAASRMPRVRRFRAGHLRYGMGAAVVLAAVVGTAVAFGWPQGLINFVTAPSAPKRVQSSFGRQNVNAPLGMSPQAIPSQTRRIMSARFDATGIHKGPGGWHVLYVAPTRDGGFCFQWTGFLGSCFNPTPRPRNPRARAAGPLGISWMGDTYPKVIAGYVRAGKTTTLEARFGNGGHSVIPVTWVSAPIKAGFFIFVAPAAHQSSASGVTSLDSRDRNGKLTGRAMFPMPSPLNQMVPGHLPDGTRVDVSVRAELSSARKLISFRATNGSEVWLWVMSARGRGTCYVTNQGDGCSSPATLARGPAFAGGLSIGARRVLFFAQAKPEVATIELLYQGGTHERLTPIDGYVLHEITPHHYQPGKRLKAAIAFNSAGHVVYRQVFQPQMHAVYPCSKPVARGYGVKSCP
jgi:hypothetical protein